MLPTKQNSRKPLGLHFYSAHLPNPTQNLNRSFILFIFCWNRANTNRNTLDSLVFLQTTCRYFYTPRITSHPRITSNNYIYLSHTMSTRKILELSSQTHSTRTFTFQFTQKHIAPKLCNLSKLQTDIQVLKVTTNLFKIAFGISHKKWNRTLLYLLYY